MPDVPESKFGFRRPEEIPRDEKTVSVSARIPERVSKRLTKAAKDSGHPAAKLIAHAICSYVDFLDRKGGQ
jgi:hypothetical protein